MNVYVYDPTASDELSKARGIGRYIKILRENFEKEFKFTNDLKQVPRDSIFINPFFDPIKLPLTMKRVANKQIAVIHDLIRLKYPIHFPLGIKGKINLFLNTFALGNYDLIITVSDASKKDIEEILNIPSSKIRVVYSTLSQNLTNTKTQTKNKDLPPQYCIYVGDATWNKNVANIARAIKIVNIPCVFIGKVFQDMSFTSTHTEQQELMAFKDLVKDDTRFIFPGFVSDEELVSLYKNAMANILVSRDEGFGFSYLEASSVGTPSILADEPIFHETAADTVLFAQTENAEDIAQKIKQLYDDKPLRASLGKKAQARVSQFSPTQFKKDFQSILDSF